MMKTTIKKMEKEIRKIQTTLRSDEGRHISGYAIRFNEQSENLGFYETIVPGAISQEMVNEQDVFALLNHNTDDVLARSKRGVGNLTLTVDEQGLRYDFDALENELGNTVLTYVRAGIIDSSSFAFAVADNGDVWERRSDGEVYRTITKIENLFDVSPVYEPAYATTSCTCRSFDKFKADEEKQKAMKDKLQAELDDIDKM